MSRIFHLNAVLFFFCGLLLTVHYFRSGRTGSTWPWWWTGPSCGSSSSSPPSALWASSWTPLTSLSLWIRTGSSTSTGANRSLCPCFSSVSQLTSLMPRSQGVEDNYSFSGGPEDSQSLAASEVNLEKVKTQQFSEKNRRCLEIEVILLGALGGGFGNGCPTPLGRQNPEISRFLRLFALLSCHCGCFWRCLSCTLLPTLG